VSKFALKDDLMLKTIAGLDRAGLLRHKWLTDRINKTCFAIDFTKMINIENAKNTLQP